MENQPSPTRLVASKLVTPTTKRIGIICLTVLATTAQVCAAFGVITPDDAAIVVVPVVSVIAALIDGGR